MLEASTDIVSDALTEKERVQQQIVALEQEQKDLIENQKRKEEIRLAVEALAASAPSSDTSASSTDSTIPHTNTSKSKPKPRRHRQKDSTLIPTRPSTYSGLLRPLQTRAYALNCVEVCLSL